MDSGQSYEKQQLVFVDAVDDAMTNALQCAVQMLREHGVPDPSYVASAGIMGVLTKLLYSFFVHSGMAEQEAEAKAKALFIPISQVADDAYWKAKEHQRQLNGHRSHLPPVSLN